MSGEYFVMLNTQKGDYVALVGEDEEIAQFNTFIEADECAKNNILGEHFGYEIFRIGCGEIE